MLDTTLELINEQLRYREIGLNKGKGYVIQPRENGAFFVFSRISTTELLEEIQKRKPSIQSLDELKTIFLLGPTPTFFGENRATTSWRREFVEYTSEWLGVGLWEPLTMSTFDDRFMVVLPEPLFGDWKDVDYPGLNGIEHVYAQIHWENHFINLASQTGILVLHAHFRWQGNAGPTARFEGGSLFAQMKEGKVNACVLNLPKDTQSAQYINSHLPDAKTLCERGRFQITSCSPLPFKADGVPIIDAGIYECGASEPDHLAPFFKAIVDLALTL